MTINASLLTNNTSAVDGTSVATASILPTGGCLVLAGVVALGNGGDPGAATAAGNGLTWVEVGSVTVGWERVTLLRAMGGSPSSGAVTFSCGSTKAWLWSVVEFSGVDTGGANGADAIVQSATNSVNSTSLAITLAEFADAVNNVAFGCLFHLQDEGHTPGSGFVELSDEGVTDGGDDAALMTEWKTGEDLAVDASWTTGKWSGGVAVEVALGPSGLSGPFVTNLIRAASQAP